MNDSYLNFANTSVGSKLTSMLGLPQPQRLERYLDPSLVPQNTEQPLINGDVLLGASDGGEILDSLVTYFNSMNVNLVVNSSFIELSEYAAWQAGKPVKALVFDASGLDRSSASTSLHDFFKQTVRSVSPNGRVIIIGRPPSECQTSSKATAQRALEGLTRSLAKELKKAITVQLIYVKTMQKVNWNQP